jgi:hypothetical protein
MNILGESLDPHYEPPLYLKISDHPFKSYAFINVHHIAVKIFVPVSHGEIWYPLWCLTFWLISMQYAHPWFWCGVCHMEITIRLTGCHGDSMPANFSPGSALPQKRQVETYKPVFSVDLRLATGLFHRSKPTTDLFHRSAACHHYFSEGQRITFWLYSEGEFFKNRSFWSEDQKILK